MSDITVTTSSTCGQSYLIITRDIDNLTQSSTLHSPRITVIVKTNYDYTSSEMVWPIVELKELDELDFVRLPRKFLISLIGITPE